MKTFFLKFSQFIFVFSILVGITSCGENEIETPDPSIFGYEFFPLDLGYEWVYVVDSVLVAGGGNSNVVSRSFIKEEIIELIDDENETKYKLERSFKKDSISDWQITDIWTVSIDETRAIRTEDNLSFIKLVFPAVDGASWDGNAFFDSNNTFAVASENLTVFKDWDYKLKEIDGFTVGEEFYDEVVEVSHIDDENFISRRFSKELYAKDYGLIHRRMEIYDTQNGNEELPWLERAERGFFLDQTLISFEKN